jgi:predicted GNAT superfamily acetyltransferase
MGGFDGENMVGMAIVIGTMEAGLAYGHMLGILDEYRDHKLGSSLHMALVKELKKRGIREMVWTFEPLESRNAHLYINRQGGRGVAYQADCFQVETTMHDGLSLDRMLMRVDIDNPPRQLESVSLTEALRRYPLAGSGHMPEADGVLVEIPGDLASLKEQDMVRARWFRADTRAVFSEYLNKRGFEAKQFFSGKTVDGRQSYYLLRRA